ncbi:MAG: hypothetical protein K2P20_07620 [Oscillospiraceae bacterium]|nr:hypothetical protein [Oscillospiraceae bacterium]
MKNVSSNLEVYVFLFNADAGVFDGNYGDPCEAVLFDAALALGQPVRASIYAGDMMLETLCQRVSAVKKSTRQCSTSLQVDHNLYLSLLTELIRSIQEQEHTIAIPDIALTLGKHNIFAVTFCGIAPDSWRGMCQGLTGATGFAASFRLDMDNPLHTGLFIRQLIPHGFLSGRELFLMQSPFEDEAELIPCWVRERHDIQIRFLGVQEYAEQCPPMHCAEGLSAAGMRFRKLMLQKGGEDLYQKLAMALLHNESVSNCDFSISGPFSWEQVNIPEEKLTQYALNLEHEGSGKSKAQLFQQLLHITKEDWRYLAAQIEDAVESGSLCNVRQTEHGVQFCIDIPIKGLNGASRTVRTAWIIRQPQRCSLVTAYILSQSQQKEPEGQVPLVVRDADPELFCSVLYGYASSAGARAAENCIPTPVYVSGYTEPVLQGLVGFAWVEIPDARKRFPRWLKKRKIGYAGYRGGWAVRAKASGQSFEKAKAYADAFAKVLRQNGIDCDVGTRLD